MENYHHRLHCGGFTNILSSVLGVEQQRLTAKASNKCDSIRDVAACEGFFQVPSHKNIATHGGQWLPKNSQRSTVIESESVYSAFGR